MWLKAIVFLLISLAGSSLACAQLSLPQFFSDHMVLQREARPAIWGQAEPGAQVSVSFQGSSWNTQAAPTGAWKLQIKTGAAQSQGSELVVQSGDETLKIQDVLVGEVWLASGQSNMAFHLARFPGNLKAVQGKSLDQIRIFDGATTAAAKAQPDLAGDWLIPTEASASRLSAVAFFFAQKLHQELNVPIGILESSWGGKPVETFTSEDMLRSNPATRKLLEQAEQQQAAFDPERAEAQFQKQLEKFELAVKTWRETPEAERKRRPRRPQKQVAPNVRPGGPGVLYRGMIHPLVGYEIRGAIWYQGEANAKPGAIPYDVTLPMMIKDWRQRWDRDLAFLWVQLANFKKATDQPGDTDPWPLLQNRQRKVLNLVPNTGMAVINDVGMANDIHPTDKQTPGERLARWALATTYKKPMVKSGPLYRDHQIADDTVTIRFTDVGKGLKSRDGKKLARFEVAGEDGVWHWAEARIQGQDLVVVSSTKVAQPKHVRYAWAANPEGANLVNSEGLPTSIFETD